MSLVQEATNKLQEVQSPDGILMSEPFLAACRVVVNIMAKMGTAFALVTQDVTGNIDRLEQRRAQDPERYSMLLTIVQDEVVQKQHDVGTSCTKGLLWLKRAMEFAIAILQRLVDCPEETFSASLKEAYSRTLSKYHGYVVSCAFTMGFTFVPSRETFLEAMGTSENIVNDMQQFSTTFTALLQELNTYYLENGLDDPTKA